ncbi:hypothetical protein FIBSPDRAFT_877189 [Athelia psychrophila]|uniref:BTB domain-containing protein n=1 Tax=Athelia psychrophila TaxID=1759441 RepID=A0A167W696_9AGAM|nr:hypothetical protein FIBSPDRAFT_877189 [Fibularhizoctonia sp. CBS 109695]
MFKLPQGVASGDQEMRDNTPVVAMAEPASVVKHLLQCCYPLTAVGGIAFESVVEVFKLSEAAQKYDVAGVEAIARCAIGPKSGLMINYPFEVYALAAEYKWEEEVRVAARKCLLNGPPWSYPSSQIMESVSGAILRRLDRYFTQCGDAAKTTVRAIDWPTVCRSLSNCSGCRQTQEKIWITVNSTQRSEYHPNIYWMVYLGEVRNILDQRPDGSAALDADVMVTANGKLGTCESCLKKVPAVLRTMCDMARHLEAEINKSLDKVELEVKL